jgi:putative ABC transport system permease protein
VRTGLIVLSIAVGLFAVGTIVSSRTILLTEMDRSYHAIQPSSGTVRTLQLFDEDFVRSVRGMERVADADARRFIQAQVQVGPNEWTNLQLFAVEDYERMRVNRIRPETGSWPPPEREILIERAAIGLLNAQVGDTIMIELPNEKQRPLRIAGLAHDLIQIPAQIDGTPYAYVSFETLAWFGEPYGFNELHVVATRPDDKAFARQVVNEVKRKAENSGLTIPTVLASEPGQVPLDDILEAILLLMGVLGTLSLFLSAFLIINTVSALLTQQKRQIGVMKAVGARTGQLLGMYLAMVAVYGVIALAIAAPASRVGARALSRFLAGMFNFDLQAADVPPEAISLQVTVGLMVPILASLYPFLSSLRVTAAEAMSAQHRLGKGRFGAGLVDRLLSGANLWFARRVLKRPILLSLRNTFRSKGRLLLTLTTLTLASAIFVSVFSLRDSLFSTVDALLQSWNYDVMLTFDRPQRVIEVKQQALQVPGVVETDVQIQLPVRRVRPDGSESGPMFLFATRADSELSRPPAMAEGRWLLPEDENAIVVDAIMLKEEPDVGLGDEIVLKIEGRERSWRVVGVSLGVLVPVLHANYPYVSDITARTGQTDSALVALEQHDQAYISTTTIALKNQFERAGMRITNVQTMVAEREETGTTFSILIALLMIMAVMLAIVGGLGLMGTMSINVLERTREIGVLRAIGAPNRGVAQVFILEGIVIGLLSWLLGSTLSFPLGKILSEPVGTVLMGAPLRFTFSMLGVWVWLIVVIGLSALASFLPARKASRLTVREVLAYE